MVGRIIEYCATHRMVVFIATAFIVVGSVVAAGRVPLDAIPDLSDPQVIIFTEWMGRSPDLVEDQVTYPLVSSLLAAPRVQAVRGQSMFGMSFIYVIFEEGTDLYWARSRVLEYMNTIRSRLPEGANPVLGPTRPRWAGCSSTRWSTRAVAMTSPICAPSRTSTCATRWRVCPASPRSRRWAGISASTRSRWIRRGCTPTGSGWATSPPPSAAATPTSAAA
jgi:hypothetical protein